VINQYKKLALQTKKDEQNKNPWLPLTFNVVKKSRPRSILAKVHKPLQSTNENKIERRSQKNEIEAVITIDIPQKQKGESDLDTTKSRKAHVDCSFLIQSSNALKNDKKQKRRRSRANRLVEKTVHNQMLSKKLPFGIFERIKELRIIEEKV